MTSMTFELPNTLKERIEERAASGNFSDPGAYLRSLVASDLRRAEIDRLLLEGIEAVERGEVTEWKPGDTRRLAEEMIQRRKNGSQP